MNATLGWHIFSLELRKEFSYRVDFWVKFLLSVFVETSVAYFLWSAVFAYSGSDRIGGYTFWGMVLYSLISRQLTQIVGASDHGDISVEIYQGSLNRFLVYPVSFFGYKLIGQLAQSANALVQMAGIYLAFALFLGLPPETHLGPASFLMGTVASLAAVLVYFTMVSAIELVAFWQENVWSLMTMLRFITRLLGGGMIPLSFFPLWSLGWLKLLPFGYVASFPIRSFMGLVGFREWLFSIGIALGWAFAMSFALRWIWRKGLRQYSGVGI